MKRILYFYFEYRIVHLEDMFDPSDTARDIK